MLQVSTPTRNWFVTLDRQKQKLHSAAVKEENTELKHACRGFRQKRKECF